MQEQPGAVLVVEQGLGDVSIIDLDRPTLLFGKLAEADVVLDNPYVSRRHAEIQHQNGAYRIRDLSSRNGTFVNGERVTSDGQVLKTGDRIEIARGQVVLRFESWESTITLPAYAPSRPSDLEVDARSREVRIRGQKIVPPLSRKEFDVLEFLWAHRGEAVSKDQIASRGWPDRDKGDVSDQEIEQCMRRLRLRIEPNPSQPQYIITVRGFGYKLV